MSSPSIEHGGAAPSFVDARLARLSLGGIAAGVLVLLAGVTLGRAQAMLGALCAGWLFFAGLAAGGVAFSASLRLAEVTWGRQIVPVAESTATFLVPSGGVLVVLLAAARWWMPGLAEQGAGAWLFLAARDLASMALLVAAARRYLRSPPGSMRPAILYLAAYVLSLTVWAIDLVMGPGEWAPSTVIPPFYFMGAYLAAVAWAALRTSLHEPSRPPEGPRVDLAKILFGLSILWFYLLFAGFLPVWYANMPDETGQLLQRWQGGFKPLTIAVALAVFFVPFWVLMPGSTKRRPRRVALGAASILAGLAGERFLLVLPSVEAHGAWAAVASLAVTVGLGGAFLLAGRTAAPAPQQRPA